MDLRFRDHPFYGDHAGRPASATTSIFVFDDDACGCGVVPSTCAPDAWKAVRLGPHGLRVLLESVTDLRRQSAALGDVTRELVVRRGPTVPALLELVQELVRLDSRVHTQPSSPPPRLHYEVCWNEEPGWHEAQVSRQVQAALTKASVEETVELTVRTDLSCTLYHPDDLPRPREWQPSSKKEKRRQQALQRRQKKQNHQRTTPPPSPKSTLRDVTSQGSTVDVSPSRWNGMPRIMGDFRRIAREKAGVRPCRDAPATAPSFAGNLPHVDPGRMPTLEELLQPLLDHINDEHTNQPVLGLPADVIRAVCQNALAIHHQNLQRQRDTDQNPSDQARVEGETAGLAHLDHFCKHHLHTAQRSLACVDDHQSSRLSHFLAFGCLSPRTVVRVVETAVEACMANTEQAGTGNDGTWLISHMTMRDFFLYTCLASGERFYGLKGIPVNQKAAALVQWTSFDSNETNRLWRSWATGATGLPIVDAALTELIATGYCSNRVRQNAASVLTKDLQIDWRAGAEWFQFLLADHCVGANWGNWLYFSGVGPDPKQRHFRTVSQALKYDADGTYVRKWLPDLRKHAQGEYHLRPWDFDPQRTPPIVNPESQYTWRDLQRLNETRQLMEDDLPHGSR